MRILHHLNFWASVVFIAIIFFLFFTLKFQIGKRLFLKFRIYFTKIIGRNVCDLMLFCQICENLYPQIIWFSNILLIQFSQQFFKLQKIVLATFFCAWYYIFDHSRMFILAETHSGDTISESDLPAFCEFFSFQKFVSRKFLPLWYWILSCLFEYCFSLNNLLEKFFF